MLNLNIEASRALSHNAKHSDNRTVAAVLLLSRLCVGLMQIHDFLIAVCMKYVALNYIEILHIIFIDIFSP